MEGQSQSAFVRGFIDDLALYRETGEPESQSAFVRGFIDDRGGLRRALRRLDVSIRVRARLHR